MGFDAILMILIENRRFPCFEVLARGVSHARRDQDAEALDLYHEDAIEASNRSDLPYIAGPAGWHEDDVERSATPIQT